MLRLRTFGTPLIERDGEPLGGAASQRRVVALLAVVAVGRGRGVSRDSVLALLWSESDSEKARQALTQSLYHARRAVRQDDLFFASADLRLNPDVISTDVGAFEDALDAGDLARGVAFYQGAFLDGFHVSGAPEFERWATEERDRLKGRCVRALEQLADTAVASSGLAGALEFRRRLAALEPLNSRIAFDLMQSMAAGGDRAGAIRFAEIHQALLRDEFEAIPNPSIAEFADELRRTAIWRPDPPEPRSTTVELQSTTVETPTEPSILAPTRPIDPVVPRRPSSRWIWVAVGGAAALLVILALGRWRGSPTQAPVAEDMIVIVPFRVAGADPSLGYLREGLMDLLGTTLPGDGGARAVDAGAVMNAWKRAGLSDRADVARDDLLKLASRLGGNRLLVGSVVGAPSRLVINASLLDVPVGRLRAQASAEGTADSLATIVDRLVARLLVREAGEWERLSSHMSSSTVAVRRYLDGRAAYRGGRYREAVRRFRQALESDQAFAMAGLALATAAERINANDDRTRGLSVAWEARGSLSEPDSVYLDALAGPAYPGESAPRDHLRAWERAVTAAPDRASVWHELGEYLFYDGRVAGVRDWARRAEAAFRRAAELDNTFASPVQYLLQLAAAERDTAAVREYSTTYLRLDSNGDLASFVRWRSATALDDSATLRSLRRRMATIPTASLRAIMLSSQYNGIGLEDAERAAGAIAARVVRGTDRTDLLLARHAMAINGGDLPAAHQALQALADEPDGFAQSLRLRVLDRIIIDDDADAASVAARRLRTRTAAIATTAPTPDQAADQCALGQWEVWSDSLPPVDSVAAWYSSSGLTQLAGSSRLLCAALLNAALAVRTKAPDAGRRIEFADSAFQFGPSTPNQRLYAGLLLSRLFRAVSDAPRALAAVRRRPYMREWPRYLAPSLREEGDVALVAGDSSGAARAYEHYVALRSRGHGSTSADLAEVRSILRALTAAAGR